MYCTHSELNNVHGSRSLLMVIRKWYLGCESNTTTLLFLVLAVVLAGVRTVLAVVGFLAVEPKDLQVAFTVLVTRRQRGGTLELSVSGLLTVKVECALVDLVMVFQQRTLLDALVRGRMLDVVLLGVLALVLLGILLAHLDLWRHGCIEFSGNRISRRNSSLERCCGRDISLKWDYSRNGDLSRNRRLGLDINSRCSGYNGDTACNWDRSGHQRTLHITAQHLVGRG